MPFIERRVFRPIGISAGLNGKRSMPPKNDLLEAHFLQSGKRVSTVEITRHVSYGWQRIYSGFE